MDLDARVAEGMPGNSQIRDLAFTSDYGYDGISAPERRAPPPKGRVSKTRKIAKTSKTPKASNQTPKKLPSKGTTQKPSRKPSVPARPKKATRPPPQNSRNSRKPPSKTPPKSTQPKNGASCLIRRGILLSKRTFETSCCTTDTFTEEAGWLRAVGQLLASGEYEGRNFIVFRGAPGTHIAGTDYFAGLYAKFLQDGQIEKCKDEVRTTIIPLVVDSAEYYVKQYRVLHTDIHPDNVMFAQQNGQLKATLIDWGRAETQASWSEALAERVVKFRFSRTPPNSDAQNLIDEGIAEYKGVDLNQDMSEAVQALKTRRNSLSAISRLPPEILSHIFILGQPEFPGILANRFYNDTSILGVCRYWNEIAMNTPQLWSNLDLFQPEPSWGRRKFARSTQRMNELLDRAKSSPLWIRCRLPEYEIQTSTFIRSGNVEKLWVYSQATAPIFRLIGPQSEMSCPPPLKALSVTTEGIDLRLASSNLLWTSMPSLQALTLTGFAILDTLPSLPCLKSLTLEPTQSDGIESNLTMAWLVSSLVSTPVIESIQVRFSKNPGTNAVYPPSDLRVTLACLKHLRVLGLDPKAYLFTHLEVPPSAIIHAYCVGSTPEQLSDLGNYQSVIERFTKWNGGSTIERIIIMVQSGFRIDIYRREGKNSRPLLHLSLGIVQLSDAITDSCLADLCHSLPFSSTRRLSFSLRSSKPEEDVYLDPWVELLHNSSQIKRLDIYKSGHAVPILKGLFKPPYDDVLCNSALKVVTILDGIQKNLQNAISLKYIIEDMIHERIDAGAPLKELRLNEGLLKASPLKNVGDLVSIVYIPDAKIAEKIPKFIQYG
ncbi:hypothetical protein ONZ45_g11734 [Pleurotus djamor]|nr:hypothetical protein ONZ45_g11734 [Pleurotus djamor]